MNIEFQNRRLKKLAENERKCYKELGERRAQLFLKRLDDLFTAGNLEDVRHLPGNNNKIMAASKFIPVVVFHPGVTLAEKLEEMQLDAATFAVRVGLPISRVEGIIEGKQSIDSNVAGILEEHTRIPCQFWMTKQERYDEYVGNLKHRCNSRKMKWNIWPISRLIVSKAGVRHSLQ